MTSHKDLIEQKVFQIQFGHYLSMENVFLFEFYKYKGYFGSQILL